MTFLSYICALVPIPLFLLVLLLMDAFALTDGRRLALCMLSGVLCCLLCRFLFFLLGCADNRLCVSFIEEFLKDYTMDDAVQMMLDAGLPAGPINTIDRVVVDPHIAGAREMFVTVPHPTAGNMKIAGNQIKLSETPVEFDRPAPLLGQHMAEILKEQLGYDEATVEALKAEGVL